jgi:hypothetical protein
MYPTMASQSQIDANRANAQSSTGPKTEEGKAASSKNARRHGLLSTSCFYYSDEEQDDYEQLERDLRAECQPETEAENQTFVRYAFNTYQLIRAQRFEAESQEAYIKEANEANFLRMERMTKLTALIERRVDKALAELRKLQRDRFHSLEVQNEMYLLEMKAPIPVSLPLVEMAKSDLRKTSPVQLATMLLNNLPEVRAIVINQTKPIEDLTEEDSDEDLPAEDLPEAA